MRADSSSALFGGLYSRAGCSAYGRDGKRSPSPGRRLCPSRPALKAALPCDLRKGRCSRPVGSSVGGRVKGGGKVGGQTHPPTSLLK